MEEKKYLKWYNKIGYGSGELGEIPTTDDATNCNDITWIIKYLPKSRVIFFISSMTW